MKANSRSASDHLPIQSVLDELAFVRRMFREIITHFTTEVESDLAQIASLVSDLGEEKAARLERAHDLRDMLLLIRSLDVKADKGRRRDLKRIETLVCELREIATRW